MHRSPHRTDLGTADELALDALIDTHPSHNVPARPQWPCMQDRRRRAGAGRAHQRTLSRTTRQHIVSCCPHRIDLGTADELALDVLINALSTLSREQLGVRALVFGGENEDWPAPKVGA